MVQPPTNFRAHHQQELTDAPQVGPFATTPNGAANQTSGYTTTSPIDLYVDAAETMRGFYTVALVATPY